MRKSSKRLLLLIAIFAVAITVLSALPNWSQTARVQSNQKKAKPIGEKAIPIVGYDEFLGHQRKESTIEPQYLELRTLRKLQLSVSTATDNRFDRSVMLL